VADSNLRQFDRLRLRNVRCFRDAEIPLDPHVTIIIGANGSGKTTLIEALASLTYAENRTVTLNSTSTTLLRDIRSQNTTPTGRFLG
jgi:exonuclease SbcC